MSLSADVAMVGEMINDFKGGGSSKNNDGIEREM